MIDKNSYVVSSLQLHLFFLRIMKEHSLFLEAGFTPANKELAQEADYYKNNFEILLQEAVKMSNGVISPNVLTSGEIITNFTLQTEEKTEEYTSIPINKNITREEANLNSNINPYITQQLVMQVGNFNKKVISWVEQLINFKKRLLNGMTSCNIFTLNYPTLIKHILREAELYRSYIYSLENGQNIENYDIKQTELFWNQIMMEHAEFIRGLLDPSEEQLINTADRFAKEYQMLLNQAKNSTYEASIINKNNTLRETINFKEFKTAGTKGINECKIESIILPLLADHVLREANHYIRLLKE